MGPPNIAKPIQGLYGQGKSEGKCSFRLGQGMSGKVREACNGLGENITFYCRSGKTCHFSSSRKCFIFFIYI